MSRFVINVSVFIFSFMVLMLTVANAQKLKGQLSISGAFALYPLSVRWSEEFRKIHPGVRIDISAGGAGKGIADALNGMVEIGMVSRQLYPEELRKNAKIITVARDAVVPVMSDRNPQAASILRQGVSRKSCYDLWFTEKPTWNKCFNVNIPSSVHVYTRSDACGAAGKWAEFSGLHQEDMLGVGVYSDPGLIQAVKKDPLGIGYGNIAYIFDSQTRKQVKGIRIIPLDLNGNGTIDSDENFYNSIDDFIEAVSSGLYPSPPSRDLYFITVDDAGKNKILAAFLNWILTDGQKYVHEAGYVALPQETLTSELKTLK